METKLSEISKELNAQSGHVGQPSLVFITDQTAQPYPEEIIDGMPEGSMVVLRDYDDDNRPNLGKALRYVCKRKNIRFLVAGDLELALALDADGVHLPEYMADKTLDIRKEHPDCFITVSCHSEDAAIRAIDLGVDAIFLSPVFPTESHPETYDDESRTLGIDKVKKICEKYDFPFYALGGINMQTAPLLHKTGITGIAVIRGIN